LRSPDTGGIDAAAVKQRRRFMTDPRATELYRAFLGGAIDRRTFIRRAMALGLSLTAVGHVLRANSALAQDASPAAGGALAPPVVAEPGSASAAGWEGKELTVQAIDDSVLIPWDEVRPEFEAATGAKLTIVPDPIGDAFPRLLDDAASGQRYDAANWSPPTIFATTTIFWPTRAANSQPSIQKMSYQVSRRSACTTASTTWCPTTPTVRCSTIGKTC
jgi:DNA-binding transcriptional MerR regulator